MTHELTLIVDLVRKVDSLAAELGARKVSKVRMKIGAWVPLSVEVLQDHFALASRGTVAEGASLQIARTLTPSQDILLESIEAGEDGP